MSTLIRRIMARIRPARTVEDWPAAPPCPYQCLCHHNHPELTGGPQ